MDARSRYVIGAAALISLTAMARTAGGQPVARMTVHLGEYAQLTSEELARAQRETTYIYGAVGIGLVWVMGHAEDHPATGLDVRVVLLNGAMSNKKVNAAQYGPDVLGAGGHGGWAYVFVSRVVLQSITAGAPFPRVLGRVIAHELGHVVLPVNGHTERGIMQQHVDMLPHGDRYFTPTQTQILLNTLTAPH